LKPLPKKFSKSDKQSPIYSKSNSDGLNLCVPKFGGSGIDETYSIRNRPIRNPKLFDLVAQLVEHPDAYVGRVQRFESLGNEIEVFTEIEKEIGSLEFGRNKFEIRNPQSEIV
jgi:hypothetical protein